MQIRTATLSDAPAIAAVHEQSARTAYRDIFPGKPFRGPDWAETLKSPGTTAFVAEEDGSVVGVVVVRPAEVEALYVAPARWGEGIGRRLLEHATQHLGEYEEITLWVLEENLPARRFYERHGWAPDGGDKESFYGAVELRYRRTNEPGSA
jgi:ribosomal protein S18 acetylase RimI-like enzyme